MPLRASGTAVRGYPGEQLRPLTRSSSELVRFATVCNSVEKFPNAMTADSDTRASRRQYSVLVMALSSHQSLQKACAFTDVILPGP